MFEAGIVDAFTTNVFGGNPAAVVHLHERRNDEWLQAVAAEFNLSETAFVSSRANGEFDLRWFTPTTEVELCGHATLAAAHWLWENGYTESDEVSFRTASGPLTAQRSPRGITLDFPLVPIEDRTPLPGLGAALGDVDMEYVGQTGHQVQRERKALVVLSASDLRTLRPDFRAIARLRVGGVIVTAPADQDGVDFLSRYFAPSAGVNEDPVTGSAHCTLITYWDDRLKRNDLSAFQASARGGHIHLKTTGQRVLLTGRAVSVADVVLHT